MNYIINCLREKSNSKTLRKHVARENHFATARLRILKRLKKNKQNQESPPFGKFVTEVLIFAVANTFFQLSQVFFTDSHTNFCFGLLWKHDFNLRSSHWSCSVKKGVNFTGKHLTLKFPFSRD